MKNRNPGRAENPYIEFLHVSKAFNEQPVLEDVSFDVRRGEMVAILGRSGVGKSVTLKHILGFLKPDAGQVLVAGREVSALSEEELMDVRRRVTMVFQSGALFDSLTVGENVAYPLRERAVRGLAVSEDEIQQRVDELLGAGGTGRHARSDAFRPEHRHETRRGDCARAGGGARVHPLR